MKSNRDQIIIKCEKQVAYDSPDHIIPEGTRKDNSKNRLFNHKIYSLFGDNKRLKILDLGCSGGGFVKDCIDDGHLSIGIEGSDYSKKFKRAEWRTIPESLFTGDITKSIDIIFKNAKRRVLFDIITCWEVLEHIAEKDLIKVAENIKKHLNDSGLLIVSIASYDSFVNGINLHQTVKSKSWWIKKFRIWGFTCLEDYERYFNKQFVRGPFQDDVKNSFNLVLKKIGGHPPKVPRISFRRNLWEKWISSRLYKIIKMFLGEYRYS